VQWILAAVSLASAASTTASTSARTWFLIFLPKLVDTGNADGNHIRCLGQQLILIGGAIDNFHVTVEQKQWRHQNATTVIFH